MRKGKYFRLKKGASLYNASNRSPNLYVDSIDFFFFIFLLEFMKK